MRARRVLAGTTLLLIGVVLLALVLTVQFPEGSHDGSVPWSFASSTSFPVAATVTWTGATSGTRVYLSEVSGDCGSIPPLVANGSGSSGSFRLRLSPGTYYYMWACNDPAANATTFALLAVGAPTYATPLAALSAGFLFVGVFVLLTGQRKAPPKFARIRPGRLHRN